MPEETKIDTKKGKLLTVYLKGRESPIHGFVKDANMSWLKLYIGGTVRIISLEEVQYIEYRDPPKSRGRTAKRGSP